MKLESVYKHGKSLDLLYNLLSERTVEQSISHKSMPTYAEHMVFVSSRPYHVWYIIKVDEVPVGSVYISKQREIGIFIFKEHQGKGYAEEAVKIVMEKWPGKFLANVNPLNEPSHKLFQKLGFKPIQVTYAL